MHEQKFNDELTRADLLNLLQNLLATIHRDGGHHALTYGLGLSTSIAQANVQKLYALKDSFDSLCSAISQNLNTQD